MKYILSRAGLQVLEQFAWSHVLVAFDYDGTLAPIVAQRKDASMRPRTRALLAQLALRYPCVVISGRARADTRRRLNGVALRAVIGNHGLEQSATAPPRLVHDVQRWQARLAQALGPFPGVEIEGKSYSLAVHYRRSREKKRARAAIVAAAAALGPVRLIAGKQVVNVLPDGAPHKGMALERARARLGCDTAIYVGDDETDEDVFALDQPGQLLAIRVGAKQTSSAAFYLRRQAEMDRLLEALVALRNPFTDGAPR